MSDMGDDFKAMNKAAKEHRANMLQNADVEGWTMHTEYHYSRLFNGEKMEWWPSGGKAKFRNKMIYTHKKVNALIETLKGTP